MKREELLKRLGFNVPENRKKRVIVHSDIAAEADDAFAIVHHLLTPSEDVRGIIAANFEWKYRTNPRLQAERGKSMERSYQMGQEILNQLEIDDVPLVRGSVDCISDSLRPGLSDGARLIIDEALRADDSPLYIALQAGLTDLAQALLARPEIAAHIAAAIWIGGAAYPDGGPCANLQQDVYAAQVIFDSTIPLWQIPRDVYSSCTISLTELTARIKPCGKIGSWLNDLMLGVNAWYGAIPMRLSFPHGESWCLGDQPTVGVLLQIEDGSRFRTIRAPHIDDDMSYRHSETNREIRVYEEIDRRLMFEDFYLKLQLIAKEQCI